MKQTKQAPVQAPAQRRVRYNPELHNRPHEFIGGVTYPLYVRLYDAAHGTSRVPLSRGMRIIDKTAFHCAVARQEQAAAQAENAS